MLHEYRFLQMTSYPYPYFQPIAFSGLGQVSEDFPREYNKEACHQPIVYKNQIPTQEKVYMRKKDKRDEFVFVESERRERTSKKKKQKGKTIYYRQVEEDSGDEEGRISYSPPSEPSPKKICLGQSFVEPTNVRPPTPVEKSSDFHSFSTNLKAVCDTLQQLQGDPKVDTSFDVMFTF